MAVSIQQQLLAGRKQRLKNHLVRGGGAIRGKKGAARAERLRRNLLRFGDYAGGFHERVEHRHRDREVGAKNMLADELVKITGPRAVPQRIPRGMSRRMPGILCHQYIAFKLIIKRGAGFFLKLSVEDAVHPPIITLFSVEIAIHRFRKERIHHFVFFFLRNQYVDIQLGTKTGDFLHQLQRRHLQIAGTLFTVFQGIERVIHQYRLNVTVVLDGLQCFARSSYARKTDT